MKGTGQATIVKETGVQDFASQRTDTFACLQCALGSQWELLLSNTSERPHVVSTKARAQAEDVQSAGADHPMLDCAAQKCHHPTTKESLTRERAIGSTQSWRQNPGWWWGQNG
ncbi:hypothetical protein C0Q70_01480 [Pomacea canaliculata]|uniref:Uncharacterized protein n=1 Tax=Pomacea canaliculata TaxID=400727 RepID=A0A2T7PZK1_POMCA|nr:hypothetical protein C0Q70_01480 [Pomacea canaliculata]